ncbi:MAG: MBL fold metallo-hydrolase [Flavisolibacter sp.]
MKIAFHGAARTVTGSKHLISTDDGKKVLLDCGMFQGMGGMTDSLNRDFGFEPSQIEAMVLSHAHIDHTGLIPRLVKQGFRGKIFCTDATRELSALLLEDSAFIQESDAKYHNKGSKAQGAPLLQPLYTVEDAKNSQDRFMAQAYEQWFQVVDNVEAMFTDAGHILGSACVHLRIKEGGKQKQISFSGDVGRYTDIILKAPELYSQSDYIIMESTYGNSLHEDAKSSVEILLNWIDKTCLQQKGKLIIPAFSLGRTQELLYVLNQLELQNQLLQLDYFLDSPLSTSITEVIKKYPQYFNTAIQEVMKTDQDPFSFKGLSYIKTVEESKLLNYRNEPCVIISASGMADAGRVKHHISNNIENSKNAILMTGYCEPNSLGGRLLAGDKEVKIFGVEHQVHAQIGGIKSMSAHGDYKDLIKWISCQQPGKIKELFLVHGEYPVQTAFKERLIGVGFEKVTIPERHYETQAL